MAWAASIRTAVALGTLALVEDDVNSYPALMGVDLGLGNVGGGEAVNLHKDFWWALASVSTTKAVQSLPGVRQSASMSDYNLTRLSQ